MRNRILFGIVTVGLLGALVSAYVYARPKRPQPPVFNPVSNPYGQGIFANGIVESDQASGENVSIYPEVAGTVTRVLVREGASVTRGAPLFEIDDAVQRAVLAQQRAQVDAARAVRDQLAAEPRPETLRVATAQVEMARANLRSAEDQFDKQESARAVDERAVSKDAFDNAENAVRIARANLEVVGKQYELTKAGAWKYDLRNQERQVTALDRGAAAAAALLGKYTVRAPTDGIVMSIHIASGSYVSPQGAYNSYTQAFGPAAVMGNRTAYLDVRCYIDEILIPKLPPTERMQGRMFVRGTAVSVPLEFVRVQPYVSPKVQLSNAREERVDLRVLPLIFRFVPPRGVPVYPGQLVDVYVGAGS